MASPVELVTCKHCGNKTGFAELRRCKSCWLLEQSMLAAPAAALSIASQMINNGEKLPVVGNPQR